MQRSIPWPCARTVAGPPTAASTRSSSPRRTDAAEAAPARW